MTQDADALADQISRRFENRRCMSCDAASGDEPLLPPGWSHCQWGPGAAPEMQGRVAAFFCPTCRVRLQLPEARNYGRDLN